MTAIRGNITGEYFTYMALQAASAVYDLPIVQPYKGFGGDYADIYADEVGEGAVVRFDTGGMVKIKSDIYCRKHKSKELTETNKGIIQCAIDGTLDDIIPQLEEELADEVKAYQAELFREIAVLHEGLRHILSFRKHMDQKEFALDIQAEFPRVTQGLLFHTRKSGDGYAELIKLIKNKYNKEAELVELFNDLSLPLWIPTI